MFPPISPVELTLVLLAEFLFGIGFNALVEFAHKNGIWSVLVSVSIGVLVTGLIPLGVWGGQPMTFLQAGAIYLMCFIASGIPMGVGFSRRMKIETKKSHKRQPIPPSAARERDSVVMDLSALADEIASSAKTQTLRAGDLPDYVHRLHQAIGGLRNL